MHQEKKRLAKGLRSGRLVVVLPAKLKSALSLHAKENGQSMTFVIKSLVEAHLACR